MFRITCEGFVPAGSLWEKLLYFGLLTQIIFSVINGFFFYDDRAVWIGVIGLIGIHFANYRALILLIGVNGIIIIVDIIRLVFGSVFLFLKLVFFF
jgi:hypothetical protein